MDIVPINSLICNWQSEFSTSSSFLQYFGGYGNLKIEKELRGNLETFLYNERFQKSKQDLILIYTHYTTKIDCFNEYQLMSGYEIEGFFYPESVFHNKHSEIRERSLVLQTRHKTTKVLYYSYSKEKGRYYHG